jgi:aspartyl-tRNA synthetase
LVPSWKREIVIPDCGTPGSRDMIAFPKTAKGTDLMTDSAAAVSPRQLRDLISR